MALPWIVDPGIKRIAFFRDAVSTSGGQSMTGSEQVVLSPAGRWRATMTLFNSNKDSLRVRAILAQLLGRTGTVEIGPYDNIRPADASGRPFSFAESIGHSDGSLFWDHTGYMQADTSQGKVAIAAAVMATEIVVDLTDGPGPQPGHYFGIAQRLYIVRYVWNLSETRIKTRFWPGLREDVAVDAPFKLARPVCTMRLAKDDSGEFEYQAGPNTTDPVFQFVEAF